MMYNERKNLREKGLKDFGGDGGGRAGLLAAAVLVCLLFAAVVFLWFRLRGGEQVKPLEDGTEGAAAVVLFRQDDARWAEDGLGDSEYTMGSSGCLVSCVASALSMESGGEVTPGMLNAKFSAENVYDGEGNLQWGALAGLKEYQVEVCGEVSAETIDACLRAGHFPVVRVRMYALGNFHYVLIVGAEDGEYLCMDPLEDGVTKLSRCGNRVYAIRCVYPVAGEGQESEAGDSAP